MNTGRLLGQLFTVGSHLRDAVRLHPRFSVRQSQLKQQCLRSLPGSARARRPSIANPRAEGNQSQAPRWGFVLAAVFCMSACSAHVNGVPEPRTVPQSSIETGRSLMASYGCGSCHTIPGVPGADAMAAPPLGQFYERSYIAGQLSNTTENLIKWIQDPQEIDPGNAMPDLGVTQEEARDMAAYLYDPPDLDDWLGR